MSLTRSRYGMVSSEFDISLSGCNGAEAACPLRPSPDGPSTSNWWQRCLANHWQWLCEYSAYLAVRKKRSISRLASGPLPSV